MGWSKRDFVVTAYEEIGLSESDLSAEQLQSGLRRLDAMMAAFNARGIRLGYPLPSDADGSDLAQPSGVPDSAYEAIFTNLAIRLGSTIGRAISIELKVTAKQAYDTLLALASKPPERQMPSGLPAGAGNRCRNRNGRPFLDGPTDSLDAGDDGELEFE